MAESIRGSLFDVRCSLFFVPCSSLMEYSLRDSTGQMFFVLCSLFLVIYPQMSTNYNTNWHKV